jgi:hypothetical protein
MEPEIAIRTWNETHTINFFTYMDNIPFWRLQYDEFKRFLVILKNTLQESRIKQDYSFDFVNESSEYMDREEGQPLGHGTLYRTIVLFTNVENHDFSIFDRVVLRFTIGQAMHPFNDILFSADGNDVPRGISYLESQVEFIRLFWKAVEATVRSMGFTRLLRAAREDFVAQRYKPSRIMNLSEEDAERLYLTEGEPEFGTLKGVYGGKAKKRSKKRSKKTH